MFAEQRRRLIEVHVNRHGSVSIDSLLQYVPVSKMTLWRDLKALHAQGRVRKVHGGAERVADGPTFEPGFHAKSSVHHEAKERIARFAATNLIGAGDVVLLEGGTTAMRMVRYIQADNVTLLTNGLNTLNAAAGSDIDVTVMVCGGILRQPSLTFVGPEAERFFGDFAADSLFLSGTGLDIGRGLTDPNPLEIQVKRAMIGCARRLVLLVDSSKFGVQSLKQVCALDEVSLLVSDAAAPGAVLHQMREHGVEVVLAT